MYRPKSDPVSMMPAACLLILGESAQSRYRRDHGHRKGGKMRRLILIFIAALMLTGKAGAATDVITPDPSITPDQVVAIQLLALQRNDTPEPDYGIRQTWAFAHPQNREMTGPFPRFASMIKSATYKDLINHRSHTITLTYKTESWVRFEVLMEDQKGRVLSFHWVVKKVSTSPFEDCWMTSAVTAPTLAGQGS